MSPRARFGLRLCVSFAWGLLVGALCLLAGCTSQPPAQAPAPVIVRPVLRPLVMPPPVIVPPVQPRPIIVPVVPVQPRPIIIVPVVPVRPAPGPAPCPPHRP
jgi:hypothetical protein